MDGRLLRLLGGPRVRRVGPWTLRQLTAREVLSAREEAAERAKGDEEIFGLWCNAAVLARSASRRWRRRFRSADDVLARMTMEEIEKMMSHYESGFSCAELSPVGDETAHREMGEALRVSPYERLKWRVLRMFSALPTEPRVRAMTDADFLYCALHLALDGQERLDALCPDCRARAEEARCSACGAPLTAAAEAVNPAFDEEKFRERKRGDGA